MSRGREPSIVIRILFLIGTRPEAIKMAPLVLGASMRRHAFEPIVCSSGQHREMLEPVLAAFGVGVDHDLSIMSPDQSLSQICSRVLERLDHVLMERRPDVVLVQGDTTSAFAGALAAFYRRIPVAHIEAGLRTGDMDNPFPEEASRVLIDHVARYCFAPTELNRRALLSEGVPGDRIMVTGNTAIDALLWMREHVAGLDPSVWRKEFGQTLAHVADRARLLALITAHRRESFGDKMEGMFRTIDQLARSYPAWSFVYPVHMNPKVRAPAQAILHDTPNVHLIEPLAYPAFVYLMNRVDLILTDSGGIQEEAPSLGKPVIVMRDKTERREAVEAGTVVLAGASGEALRGVLEPFLAEPDKARRWPVRPNPFGDGRSASRILDFLERLPAASKHGHAG